MAARKAAEGGVEIRDNPRSAFSPLSSYPFLIFNLLRAPCFAAIGAIRRKMGGAKWAWIAIVCQTGLAYAVSLMVYQLGSLFTGTPSVSVPPPRAPPRARPRGQSAALNLARAAVPAAKTNRFSLPRWPCRLSGGKMNSHPRNKTGKSRPFRVFYQKTARFWGFTARPTAAYDGFSLIRGFC